jgi:mobilome CxxCx(11)CxxC protein
MLDQARTNAIYQRRMDALATKHLHEYRCSSLNKLNLFVDLLAIGVPVLYLPVRYLAKGTSMGSLVESAWEILAGILLVLVIIKIIWRWQDKAAQHSKLIGENISLATQAEQLLNNASTTTVDSAQWFLVIADNLEKADMESFGRIKNKDRQCAYREALKEFSPGLTTACPECGASPWHYKPGSCQLCGNTPIQDKLERS